MRVPIDIRGHIGRSTKWKLEEFHELNHLLFCVAVSDLARVFIFRFPK